MTTHNNKKQSTRTDARVRIMRIIAWPCGGVGVAGLGRLCLDGAPSAPDMPAAVFYAALCFVPMTMILLNAALPHIGSGIERTAQALARLVPRPDDGRGKALPEAS
jgi:hypothetical protein